MTRSRHLVLLSATLLLAVNLLPQAAGARQARQDSAVSDTALGVDFFKNGQFDTAARVLRGAVKQNAADFDAWYYLGLALTRKNEIKDARKAFERAVSLQPRSAAARVGLAYALLLSAKNREAAREAGEVLTLDSRNAEAQYIIGVTRMRDGQPARALEAAEEALKINPRLNAAVLLKSQALLSMYADVYPATGAKHPFNPWQSAEEREQVLAAREAELEPLKARLREAAGGLEKIVKSEPGNEDAKLWHELLENVRCYSNPRASSRNTSEVEDATLHSAETTTKAILTYKPEPGYTDEARSACVSGVVRLKLVLTADGRVTCILPVETLGYGLTERSIRAARRIKFTPATKGGRPVSQWITIEYGFRCG